MNRLIIIGASGHGKVVADIAKNAGYEDIAFLDDDETVSLCGTYAVIGTSRDAERFSEADFIVAIGNAKIREVKQLELKNAGLKVTTLIHPSAVISDTVSIAEGTVVMAGAIINPDTNIGRGCIINTSCSIDHDCVIGDFAHISVGSHLAGTVNIGSTTWIGAGAIVSNNINICNNTKIGAGAVVVKDIDEPGIYIGVPAKYSKEKTVTMHEGGNLI